MCAPKDLLAVQSKALQTELMVAALTCNAQPEYNRFISKFNEPIRQNGTTLRRFFRSLHGANGERKLNHLVTELANDASRKNNRGTVAFCRTAQENFTTLLSQASPDLTSLAQSQPLSHDLVGVVACQN